MKWKKYPNIFFVLIVSILASCSKFLDKKASTDFATPETLEVIQSLLDNSNIFNIGVSPSFGEASSDDYFVQDGDLKNLSENLFKTYQWIPVQYNYINDWAVCYTAVYNANLCLESVGKIPQTLENSPQWNYIRGAALFHRAYAFLNLAWTFCKAYDPANSAMDLGIDLRLQTDYTIPSKRSSVKETYLQIIDDANEAFDRLPENTGHVFRPGKAAAAGLLARVYLTMSNYDSAYKYATESLKLNNYLIDYNDVEDGSLPFSQQAYSAEVLFYSTLLTVFPSNLIQPSYDYACIDTLLYRMYDANDLRKKLLFRPLDAFYAYKGTYATNISNLFSGITTAEMYLIKSECLARAGKVNECLLELNTLLKKRIEKDKYEPAIAADKDEAINLVLNERRKELVMRGLRWSDIKRFNKEGRLIIPERFINGEQITLPPGDKRYALPIPQDIIDLTGIEQN